MLVSLTVKNFAIIDNIEIDFKDGMTVLTGETGAGKSLIIDAIGLLFGQRAASDMIRFGESKAVIEGVFSINHIEINKYLQTLGIDANEEDFLVVKRELYSSGKSTCRLNNFLITLGQLSEISEYIGDIHSQHDTLGLVNPKNYLKFITNQEIENLITEYQDYLQIYKQDLSKYQKLLKESNENKEKEDFLRYQLQEYETANISNEEEDNLKNELEYLANFEKISENINEINEIVNTNQIIENLYQILSCIIKLEKFDKKFSDIRQNIEDCYYNLEENLQHPLLKSANLDFDIKRLDEINQRLSVYSDLKRKYKKETHEIIEHFQKIKSDLDLIENYDFYLQELKNKLDKSYIKTIDLAKNIRAQRIKISKDFVEKVKIHLQDLHLKNIVFEITFNEIDEDNINFKNNGIDEIDFMVSFNKGEPVKPLAKTASGGELSRFMLAIKTVLGKQIPTQLKIFDEIDHGVSGAVAYSIAEKIKYIAKTSQVLCITHLPQVASTSNHHYKISKINENGRTYTKIQKLSENERIIEIATMISKGKPTQASINLAKELISTTANF